MPQFSAITGNQCRQNNEETAAICTQAELTLVHQRACNHAHGEEKENLEGAYPSDGRGRRLVEENGFVVGLKYAIGLRARLAVTRQFQEENRPG